MELIILGASGAWPAPGGAANGFLVRAGGYHLVLDFGMAVLPNLQRYLPHEQIDAIFISHEHWDHCLDLYFEVHAACLGLSPAAIRPR
jgi:ribonuclease BN (tRNA processing enzyme)